MVSYGSQNLIAPTQHLCGNDSFSQAANIRRVFSNYAAISTGPFVLYFVNLSRLYHKALDLAGMVGIGPTTYRLGGGRSNPLSYIPIFIGETLALSPELQPPIQIL